MASIEAVYIIDLNGKVVLDYPTCPSPPPIESLIPHIISPETGAILSASSETMRTGEANTALLQEYQRQLQPPIIEITSSLLLFHQKYGNIVFLLPCTSTTPALIPFEFITRLIETLEGYLSTPLIPTKIESNFDLVAMILTEMIDAGLPVTTEPDSVRDFVQPSGAISKLLSTATGNTPAHHGVSAPSEIPWRRANVRHANNELFVDIIETITAVIPPTRKASNAVIPSSSSAFHSSAPTGGATARPLISRVAGDIYISSHLSGVPEVVLALNTGSHSMQYPAFHPCVRYEKFENFHPENTPSTKNSISLSNATAGKTATFSFIPPDGKFLLASYALDGVPLGLVQADLRTGLGPKRDEFEVRVWTLMSRETKYIENLALTIASPGDRVRTIKTLRVTTGDFSASSGAFGEWRFGVKTPLGWNATLRGVLVKAEVEEDDDEEEEAAPPAPVTTTVASQLEYAVDEKLLGTSEFTAIDSGGSSTSLAKPRTKKSASSLLALGPTEDLLDNDNDSIAEEKKKKKKSKKKKSKKDAESAARHHLEKELSSPSPSSSLSFGAARNQHAKKETKPIFPTHVTLSYKAIGQIPSGIKVQSLKITNARGSADSATKPFKGVRYITLTGDYVVR